MAYPAYLLTYRSFSNDELAAERASIMQQRTIFTSQAMGSKNMTRDLNLLEDRLQAVAFVMRERSPMTVIPPCTPNPCVGVTDFSKVQ